MTMRNYRGFFNSVRNVTRAAAETGEASTPGRMHAWRVHAYGALDELRLEEARMPTLRAPDELLVRVHAASINPIDVAIIGGYGALVLNVLRSLQSIEGVEFPLVPGRDFAGVVERAGPEARLRRGQFVWGVLPPHWPGSHAEYVTIRDKWAGVAPSSLSVASAGGALYAALSATAVLRAGGLTPGERALRPERVLLLGLGGAGYTALQLLVHRGAQVVVGCAGEMCERATALGAALTLDRHAPDYEGLLVDSGPYDVIVDCAGLGGDEAASRPWRFGVYATLTSPLLRETDARGGAAGAAAAAAQLAAQNARAAANVRGTCPPQVRWAYFMPNAEDIEMLRRLAEQDQFKVEVERVFPWWEGAAAFARAAGKHARGKLVLDFTARR